MLASHVRHESEVEYCKLGAEFSGPAGYVGQSSQSVIKEGLRHGPKEANEARLSLGLSEQTRGKAITNAVLSLNELGGLLFLSSMME